MQVKTLHTAFNLPIRPNEIHRWRGAFVEMAGRQYDLFHNHLTKDQYYYRYPLVHYRREKNCASILVFNQAIEGFQEILSNSDWQLRWKGQSHPLTITQLKMEEHELKMSSKMLPYHIKSWLALKQENYLIWEKCKNMTERSDFLERVLVGQLLGFATQMGWQLPERLEVNLQLIHQINLASYQKRDLLAFDVSFLANIDLPYRMALGKGVSKGFGILGFGQYPLKPLFHTARQPIRKLN